MVLAKFSFDLRPALDPYSDHRAHPKHIERVRSSSMPEETKPLVMTIPEAGRLLGLKRDAAYKAARNKQIPILTIGGAKRVPVGAVERMVQRAEEDIAK
jgi:hypothetical protein